VTSYLYANKIKIFDYPQFATPHREEIRNNADQIASDNGIKADIHPAIVAGRIRFENNNYTILNSQVGHRQIRKLFASAAVMTCRS
jgi:hypothetical protein